MSIAVTSSSRPTLCAGREQLNKRIQARKPNALVMRQINFKLASVSVFREANEMKMKTVPTEQGRQSTIQYTTFSSSEIRTLPDDLPLSRGVAKIARGVHARQLKLTVPQAVR